jgi:hypothetical protein
VVQDALAVPPARRVVPTRKDILIAPPGRWRDLRVVLDDRLVVEDQVPRVRVGKAEPWNRLSEAVWQELRSGVRPVRRRVGGGAMGVKRDDLDVVDSTGPPQLTPARSVDGGSGITCAR